MLVDIFSVCVGISWDGLYVSIDIYGMYFVGIRVIRMGERELLFFIWFIIYL